jgi:hypothetical protein
VCFDINCFGFGSWESLLQVAERLSEKYYGRFLKREGELKRRKGDYDSGHDTNDYEWGISSFMKN